MSERNDLLESVAGMIRTYRQGELPEPTPEHVDRWLQQFTKDQQLPFLREFNHVLDKTFFTQENIKSFLQHLAKNEKLSGTDSAKYWANANFLAIQQNGHSQNEMLKLFGDCLKEQYGLKLSNCGTTSGDYIYLDDVMFSGNRVGNDLERWINETAPESAKVHVIVAAMHSGGHFLVQRKLKTVIAESSKHIDIQYWRSMEIENRKAYKDSSEVLWPTSVPDVPEVNEYMALPSKYPFEPRQAGAKVELFSSEEGRQVLESEFLIAGAKIRALSENPKPSLRPLGYSSFGLGFGAMIVTYRNCPNNCPLAMWWGDPTETSGALHWYPLLQRDGYSSAKNVFYEFKDLTL